MDQRFHTGTPGLPRRAALAAAAAGLAAAVLRPRPSRAATVLRWASVLPVSHPGVAMMERVAKQVRDETGGSVEVQTFPAGQLGGSRDLIESASSGAVGMVDEGAAQFGQFVPQFSILEAPYIWRDPAHIRAVLGSPIVEEMTAALATRRSMRVIGSTYYGTRHVTTGGAKPIRGVEDMKGLKLRIPEVDTYRAMAEAWGARPTPLNIGELYLALSQGAVDGQENPLPTIQSAKLNEVQKHLVLTAHILTPRLVVVNEATWRKLAPKEQDVLRSAVAAAAKAQDDEIVAQEGKLTEAFRAGGMTVVQPDLDTFRKPVLAAVPARFESRWGKGLWDRIAAA